MHMYNFVLELCIQQMTSIMEWIFFYGVVIIFIVQVKSLPHGVCNELQRIEHGYTYRNITVTFCCDNFHKSNGVCVECPIGHHSKGEDCNICNDGQYGEKCAETCRCETTERCDHVTGCVAKYDRTNTSVTIKNHRHDNQVTVIINCCSSLEASMPIIMAFVAFICSILPIKQKADYKKSTPIYTDTSADDIFISITLRETIVFVSLIFMGLMVCLGLMFMCWKRFRERRILITPPTMIEVKADNVRRQQTENQSEGLYDEIDELGLSETSTPVAFGTQLHNSYLEVTNNSCNTLNIIGKHNSLSKANCTSLSKPKRQANIPKHRHSQKENILIGMNLQTALRHYYSDGYLRPETIAHHHEIQLMMENKVISFSNKDNITSQENNRHVYDRPAYDGIVRSNGYDRLSFSKDVRVLTNGSMFVQNSIHPTNRQLENRNKHQELATCSSKRWSI